MSFESWIKATAEERSVYPRKGSWGTTRMRVVPLLDGCCALWIASGVAACLKGTVLWYTWKRISCLPIEERQPFSYKVWGRD